MPRLQASITERSRWGRLVAVALALAIGAIFWVPSIGAGRGWFPAPLDDVYIHFDFARSIGKGHPFEWIPGQGYSSGETSPLYAVVLALGWMVGFRGRALGLWAALVAIFSVASLLGSVRRLVRPCPAWLAWLLALVPLSIGIVDWALFSGMEVALFCAALGRSLEALARARSTSSSSSSTRESLHWRLGAWGFALVLLRPEAAVIVAVLALVAARGVGRRSAFLAVLRASIPGAIGTLLVLGSNWLATGDARSAGAQLKLLSSNPYMSDEDRARVFVENIATFFVRVVRGELAVVPLLAFVLLLFALVGLVDRRRRAVAAASLVSALGWILIVSWNGNAPHHNFRYYAPALVLVGIAASFGLANIAVGGSSTSHRRRLVIASALALVLLGVAAPKIPGQVRHFRSASANIRDQHIEVGERIARLPDNTRVLLGDAGAIPYVSGRSAVDALGLGGYHRLPFARAAVHGEASVIELIERLEPNDRPTHFALYPNWFANLTGRFGVEIDRVTIENNIICGSPTKVIYRADWAPLSLSPNDSRSKSIIDEIDIADVIDEADHHYLPPLPHGGWTSLEILEDSSSSTRRFDGGRLIPDGASESFTIKHAASGPLTLRVRIDGQAHEITLRSSRVPTSKELVLEPHRPEAWRHATTTLESVEQGEVITLEAHGGAYRDFHVWIERAAAATSTSTSTP